mgnify:CR=1 FL=1
MIKCFIVKNIDNETPEGKFKENSFYIAKVANNKPNSFAVLESICNLIKDSLTVVFVTFLKVSL